MATHITTIDSFSFPGEDWADRVLLHRMGRHGLLWAAILAVSVTWVPLLILAAYQGLAWGDQVPMPLMKDIAVNARFLVALPALTVAGLIVDPRLHGAVRHFWESGLVNEQNASAFENAIARTRRLRESRLVVFVTVLLAFAPTLISKGMALVSAGNSWHTLPHSGVLSWAGLWNLTVSVPLFRLLLFRWIWMILLWALLLWRVSHTGLRCVPTHPDGACGLGFLGETQSCFGIVAFAGSAAIAGTLGNEILYEGKTFDGIRLQLLVYAVAIVLLLLAPLLVLTPTLKRCKREGLDDYAVLGAHYVESFEEKWLRQEPSENLLGSPDIQSLAEMNASFGIVRGIRLVPVDKDLLIGITLPAIVPLIALLMFSASGKDVLKRLMELLF